MEDFRLIYDFQAERSLIGAMLIAPEKVIPEAALSLSPKCFTTAYAVRCIPPV